MATQYLFVSYSRHDTEIVLRVVEAIRAEYRVRDLNIEVWVDIEQLKPGQLWDAEITRVLRNSIGLLVFVSPAAMKSDFINREIAVAMEHTERLIIPVILEHVPDSPLFLSRRQWLDLSRRRASDDLERAARDIAKATEAHLGSKGVSRPISSTKAPAVAATLAQEARSVGEVGMGKSVVPNSVFLVHGHDHTALSEVESYLTNLGVKPVILSRARGPAKSLLQRFLTSATDARFAIVILSADDFGASRIQYGADGVGEKALQFRARQNVILELGFFYGLLGFEPVFVLYRPPDKVFPNFERPSDIEGVVFDSMDATGAWRDSLAQKLAENGFRLQG
jgi:predicted nucleotide-binding protein